MYSTQFSVRIGYNEISDGAKIQSPNVIRGLVILIKWSIDH